VERPVIFPLSNPTTHSEARPEDLYRWTDGRAIVATGSPFPDYGLPDGRVISTAQANNVLVFPGMGLGALFANAREVTDGMFAAATHALAGLVTSEELAQGRVFPNVRRLREVAHAVAVAVARRAFVEGVARAPMPEDDDIDGKVRARMWRPRYRRYVPSP
jgi:malate dehydrogenase (oxaloacetate-decarboxylating)